MRILQRTWLLGTVAVTIASCSLIYPLDADQCSVNADCSNGAECVDGVCRLPNVETGGTGNTGGGDSGGTGGAGTGGTGGGDPNACTRDIDCFNNATYLGEPHICLDSQCLSLRNSGTGDGGVEGECSVVAGQENLAIDTDHFVFGAFSGFGNNPMSSPATLNYRFAIDEISAAGGVRIRGRQALPVAVVCDNDNPSTLDASFDFMVSRGIRAVVAPMSAIDLARSWQRLYDRGDNVFMITPFESDDALAGLDDQGMVWHMLPDSRSMAPPYIPLLKRVEAHLRRTGIVAPAVADEPLRVALVTASGSQYLKNIGDILIAGGTLVDDTPVDPLLFNDDQTPIQNGETNFKVVQTTFGDTTTTAISQRSLELFDFRPHVIVSAAGPELVNVIRNLELRWNSLDASAQHPPFYILTGFQNMTALVDAALSNPYHVDDVPLGQRIVGLNAAGAEDPSLYNTYYLNFSSGIANDCGPPCAGSENFYDPIYFLIYAAAGAGNPAALDGNSLGQGMQRLISGSASYNVGGADVQRVSDYFNGSTMGSFRLMGTLGPPDFHLGTGTRRGFASVFCLRQVPVPPAVTLRFTYDVMRYNPSDETLYIPGGGTFPQDCIPDPDF